MSVAPQANIDALFAALLQKMLESARIPLTDEKETQRYISECLQANHTRHKREHRLSSRDIIDLWVPHSDGGGVAIEVKLHHARPADVLRQLTRYAAHDCVRTIFLVSNRAMALPPEINGKPLHYISLGRGWL